MPRSGSMRSSLVTAALLLLLLVASSTHARPLLPRRALQQTNVVFPGGSVGVSSNGQITGVTFPGGTVDVNPNTTAVSIPGIVDVTATNATSSPSPSPSPGPSSTSTSSSPSPSPSPSPVNVNVDAGPANVQVTTGRKLHQLPGASPAVDANAIPCASGALVNQNSAGVNLNVPCTTQQQPGVQAAAQATAAVTGM